MIPDAREAEEEGKQKSKQVNADVEVGDNDYLKGKMFNFTWNNIENLWTINKYQQDI